MSSWIAPPLAAEYLNLSEQELWRRIDAGELPVCYAGDFMFVDINPEAPAAETSQPARTADDFPAEADITWKLARQQTAALRQAPKKAA